MALRTIERDHIGPIYHRDRPFKHIENSKRGARLAKRHGFPAIDWDLQITRDGVVVVCHDNLPIRHGFFDPLGKFGRDFKISDHTYTQVSRLRARTGLRLYRIRRIEEMFPHAARLGRTVVAEPKNNWRFGLDFIWEHIAAVAEAADCALSVRALRELGGVAHVAAARRAGPHAWLI